MKQERSRNRDVAAAWRFHNLTKWVRPSEEMSDAAGILMGLPPDLGPALGAQDVANEPSAYKNYPTLASIPLPREFPASTFPALDAIAATGEISVERAVPDLEALARLCLRANGVLKRWRSPAGKEIEFRAAGCTGARYHLELYLVCGDLPGLEAGVYHYAAQDHTLRRLRTGDYRAAVSAATGQEPAVAAAPVIAIWTSTFWRNAWRYLERAYRHTYWDTGTALANLLAVAADERLPTRVVLGFVDDEINALLDVDGVREAAVCLVVLGRTDEPAPNAPSVVPLGMAALSESAGEVRFPEIEAMHAASALASSAEVRDWRGSAPQPVASPTKGEKIPLLPLNNADIPADPIDAVIARRRSNRHYEEETPLSFAALSTVLERSLHGTATDYGAPGAAPLFTPYLIVNNVEGLAAGAYAVDRDARSLEFLRDGDTREAARGLACDQDYAGAAHVNIYALADLEQAFSRFGNRGYRLAQLEAALFGARVQLAAHALGLGAVGSTSFDDEVTAYFSPHAAGKSFMFVAVFGVRRRPSSAEVAAKSRFLQGDRREADGGRRER
jgi:SagB-type dehydrogenase family enzyme